MTAPPSSFFGPTPPFPAAATNNFVVFGDIVLPWNTTAPTFGGGISTARDGDYMETPYYQDLYLAPKFSAGYTSVAGADPELELPPVTPVTYYLMQANDSVTGVRYDWLAPSTPDWAGTNYPGPNAATNVSIAGIKVT